METLLVHTSVKDFEDAAVQFFAGGSASGRSFPGAKHRSDVALREGMKSPSLRSVWDQLCVISGLKLGLFETAKNVYVLVRALQALHEARHTSVHRKHAADMHTHVGYSYRYSDAIPHVYLSS
jgi:hypothetical protein